MKVLEKLLERIYGKNFIEELLLGQENEINDYYGVLEIVIKI